MLRSKLTSIGTARCGEHSCGTSWPSPRPNASKGVNDRKVEQISAEAARTRQVQAGVLFVIVVECPPCLEGHTLCQSYLYGGVRTVVVEIQRSRRRIGIQNQRAAGHTVDGIAARQSNPLGRFQRETNVTEVD